MRRHAARRDLIEPDVVKALREAYCLVYRTLPSDLLVHREVYGPGMFKVLECKSDPYLDKRQEEQSNFLFLTGSPIVRSVEEALKATGVIS